MNEESNDGRYDAQATGASKATIFTFIATFAYVVFVEGGSPGILGGAIFLTVGIFVVSLAISMPLFLLRERFPRARFVLAVLDLVLTVVVTRSIFEWVFPGEMLAAEDAFVVSCREPLPTFSLGKDSTPNAAQVAELCACVWSKLEGWGQDTARAMKEGRTEDISALHQEAFPARFGKVVADCGGMGL